MQVEGLVDEKPCRPTVETGAEKTSLQPGLLGVERLPNASQRLCGIMRHCMALKGPVEARVRVGGTEVWLQVYACLLGFHYLT